MSETVLTTKEINKKYQLLSEVEHVLKRPGMYIGSTKPHQSEEWLQNEDSKFEKVAVEYNPGFLDFLFISFNTSNCGIITF